MIFPFSRVTLFDWGVLDMLVHPPRFWMTLKQRMDVGVPLKIEGRPIQSQFLLLNDQPG